LNLAGCKKITITSLLSIIKHQLSNLTYLNVNHCSLITARFRREYRSISDLSLFLNNAYIL